MPAPPSSDCRRAANDGDGVTAAAQPSCGIIVGEGSVSALGSLTTRQHPCRLALRVIPRTPGQQLDKPGRRADLSKTPATRTAESIGWCYSCEVCAGTSRKHLESGII